MDMIVYLIMNLWRDKMIEKILNKFFKNDDVFFIGSTDILPPPLKKDIEEDLVRKSNMGDLNARNKLIGCVFSKKI